MHTQYGLVWFGLVADVYHQKKIIYGTFPFAEQEEA